MAMGHWSQDGVWGGFRQLVSQSKSHESSITFILKALSHEISRFINKIGLNTVGDRQRNGVWIRMLEKSIKSKNDSCRKMKS